MLAAATALVAVVALSGVFAPPAHALGCSATLLRDTTLQRDLLNCGGDGVTIGANGVDLNLNGFTIEGVGLGVGVRNDGFDNVTIRNGTIADFDYGVQLNTGTRDALVSGITLQLTQVRAMQLRNTDSSEISQNSIANDSRGLQIAGGSTENLISGNQITQTSNDAIMVTGSPNNTFASNRITWTGDRALSFQRSPRTKLTGNTISHNSDSAITLLSSPGSTVEKNRIIDSSDSAINATNSSNLTFSENIIRNVGDSLVLDSTGGSRFIGNSLTNVSDGGLFFGSSNNVIKDNVVTNIGDTGFSLTDSTNNLVENNTLNTIGDSGLKLTGSSSNQVLSNTVIASTDSAVTLQFSDENRIYDNDVTYNSMGVELGSSNFNVIEANDATGGLTGGIALEDSYGNQVLRNRASSTGANGIWVSGLEEPLGRNVVEGNIAHNNLTNGIFVETPRTRVAGNFTYRNHGYGIKAVPGVVGGGNHAHGNFEVGQCFNITCLF